ncbi:MAG: nucleotidyltransferase family protein [Pseudomonadota bacterium]
MTEDTTVPEISTSFAALASCFRGDFSPNIDWLVVLATANEHLVAPQLYASVRELAKQREVDRELLSYLAELTDANGDRNHRLYLQLDEVVAALNAKGIIPVLLKGAVPLVNASQPSDCLRILRDLDIMVRREELGATRETLSELGYQVFSDSHYAHSPGSYYRDDCVGAIDLHTELPGQTWAKITDPASPERLRKVSIDKGCAITPDPSFFFVINLFHDQIHDRGDLKGVTHIRYLLELRDLVLHQSNLLDWPWIFSQCQSFRARLALEQQLRMMHHYLAVPYPAGYKGSALGWILLQRRVLKEKSGFFERLDASAINTFLAVRRVLRSLTEA